MNRRLLLLCVALAAPPTSRLAAQTAPLPERAVRRDIPITNAIRRAYAAGTRDSSGRPGRNYWQLRTDYTISVRLDPSTQRLAGRETVTIRNASPDSLPQIGLRLDPNLFLGNTPQSATWVPAEVTDGMVITRMTRRRTRGATSRRQAAGRRRRRARAAQAAADGAAGARRRPSRAA